MDNSVLQNAEISRDDFVLKDRARGNIDPVTVVCDDDHCALKKSYFDDVIEVFFFFQTAKSLLLSHFH